MSNTQIERIKAKLAKLRERDPQGAVLFGAHNHQYRLNPPASEELLARFESKHGVALPNGFRQFLLEVGNGGAGPYYGLFELIVTSEADFANADKVDTPDGMSGYVYNHKHPEFEKVQMGGFSSLPQHLAANYHEAIQEEEGYSRAMLEKALVICSQGCSIETYLVIDGPFQGQVWSLDGEAMFDSGYGFWPEVAAAKKTRAEVESRCVVVSDKTNWQEVAVYSVNPFTNDGSESSGTQSLTFLDWYEHWLDTGLHFLDSQPSSATPITSQ